MIRLSFLIVLMFALFSCNNSEIKTQQKTAEPSANKAIIEEYFNHFNNHQWQKMAEMYIDQPEMKDPAYGTKNVTMSKSDIVKKYTELNQMIPDVHDKVLKMYFSGDYVIVEFESSGTAPDGSKFILPICTIIEVKNGKISKDLTYYDNFEDTE
jgi:predicted SnoaL-like aldol condensation-catalyzing enzyme